MELNDWPHLRSEKIPDDCSSSELVVQYLLWCEQVRHRSTLTVATYAGTLQQWLTYLGSTDVRAVEVEVMEAFITRPRQRRAHGSVASPATQRKDVAVLRGFYTWLWERGHTPELVARSLHGPSVHNEDPKPIPDDDWLKLWAHAQTLSDSTIAALGLGYVCGLRRHEIMGLRSSQVTPTKLVSFARKGGGDHTLPWAEMMGILEDDLPHLLPHAERFSLALSRCARRDGLLLNWHSDSPDAMNKRMRHWCADAGVEDYTPHQLRHSCATNLLAAGVPLHLASRLMNHANVQTTMRYVRAGADEFAAWRRSR